MQIVAQAVQEHLDGKHDEDHAHQAFDGPGPALGRILRERGARAVERLMGMILVMLAVQMFLNGLRDYLH